MNKFWELVETSVIVSGIISLLLVGSVCYLSVIRQPVPDTLNNATMIVVGFFFGKGSVVTVQRAAAKLKRGK